MFCICYTKLIKYKQIFQSSIELEPLDKNDKTPLMLAQSHRHSDIVQVLQSEQKRRSRYFPPITEIWGLIFGGAGDSKVPLLFFMGSVLLWGYPMYIIRVSIFITNNCKKNNHKINIFLSLNWLER